jgi:uncharacterized protein (DUF488 family)
LEIYPVGVTGRSASDFFKVLSDASVRRVLDTRLHNTSQLAGFSKKGDFEFFLRRVSGVEYKHELLLAPTEELLKAYKRRDLRWDDYAAGYLTLLRERNVEHVLSSESFRVPTALLCAEHKPDHCHRRIAAEHLAETWPDVSIRHL